MALVATDSGRYIKILRERCIFTPDAVQVFYYEFGSKKERDAYFSRLAEVQEFLKRAHEKCKEFDVQADGVVKTIPNEKDQFVADLMVVEFGWDKEEPLPSDLKSIEIFKSLGFKQEWLLPLKAIQINGLITSPFTNQTFDFPCLYKELKKIFKGSFIDC